MPPKKKDAGKGGGDEIEYGTDPLVLLGFYQKFCKTIGAVPNASVVKALQTEPENYPVDQLIVDDDSGSGPIGPGGTRALMTSILGIGPGMAFVPKPCAEGAKGGVEKEGKWTRLAPNTYKLLKSLRIWRCNIGDGGAQAVAELLELGGAECALNFLELMDDNIGPMGGLALGHALSYGKNLSLLTLKLDYNTTLSTKGISDLCKGLRTNRTLKQLHLQFCDITGVEGGTSLADVLANGMGVLEVLNLSGNRLGGRGLSALCKGLLVNVKLTNLSLADNMIDATDEDMMGLNDFKDCLMAPNSALTHVDLMYNRIGERGATILAEALGPENTRIQEFLVDLTLPLTMFEQIFRRDAGGKKKGKGKGKKGKKK